MTAQLTLGDCDPAWDDLANRGAEQLADPTGPEWRDVRRQGITAEQYHQITDVTIVGDWL